MSESAYKNHPIHATLMQLFELQQDEELAKARLALSEDQEWQIDQVFEIARVVESYLTNTPSTLTSMSSLNNINSYLQQAFAELSSYQSNKNAGHVSNASTYIESVIPQLSGFAGSSLGPTEEGIGRIVGDLRAKSTSAVTALTRMKDALAGEVDALKILVAVQEKKIEELTAGVEVQKKEAVAVTAEVRAAYSKTETELRLSFGAAIDTMKTDYSLLETTTKTAADNTLTELKRKEGEAKKIVQVVGNIGVTGNYQKAANAEATSANQMRRLTLGFFGTGVVIAVVVLVAHLFPDISSYNIADGGPWELALRLLTALAIAAPALYTARESARHRTNSDRAKQRELELASLGPFIELLPQAKKDEIVEKLTDRYFGSEVESHEVTPVVDPKDAYDLAKKAIEGLVKVAK